MIQETAIAVTAFSAAGMAAVILVPHAYAKWCAHSLARRCRRAKAVVLTYDDGPGAALTPQLMDLLRQHEVRATFFSLGRCAVRHPEILDRILSEGHELGCHGHDHRHAWKVWPHVASQDIGRGYASLARWLPATGMFRPPHGKITLFTWFSIMKRKARMVWWTHDSGDTNHGSLPPVESVARDVIEAGGGVVLLHDFDRTGNGGRQARHEFVLNVTHSLIERARESGLRIVTLGELFECVRAAPSPSAGWNTHPAPVDHRP